MSSPTPLPKWFRTVGQLYAAAWMLGTIVCIYAAIFEVDTWDMSIALLVLAFVSSVMSFIAWRYTL